MDKFRQTVVDYVKGIDPAFEPRAAAPAPSAPYTRREIVGVHPQKQEGKSWVCVTTPAGRLTAQDVSARRCPWTCARCCCCCCCRGNGGGCVCCCCCCCCCYFYRNIVRIKLQPNEIFPARQQIKGPGRDMSRYVQLCYIVLCNTRSDGGLPSARTERRTRTLFDAPRLRTHQATAAATARAVFPSCQPCLYVHSSFSGERDQSVRRVN